MPTDLTPASRQLLRHTLATLAYRGAKVIRTADASFAAFHIRDGTRTPGAILAHIGDLLDWGLALAKGTPAWRDSPPSWEIDVRRFFDGLARLDAHVASDAPLACSAEQLFQGPIADALSHVGQLAMLRRLAGSPVRGENYLKAEIAAGRVGPDQAAPRREFD